jgi:phosphatidylglycerophosphatase A
MSGAGLGWTVGAFVGFRFFDLLKPWPVRQLQHLAGGWGIVADDLMAAAWTGAVLGLAAWLT